MPITTPTPLVCEECKRADRTGLAHRWRAYILEPDPDEERRAEPELAVYCPACAEREFPWEFA